MDTTQTPSEDQGTQQQHEVYTGPDPARVHHPTPDHVVPLEASQPQRPWWKHPAWLIATAASIVVIVVVFILASGSSAPAFTTHGTLTVSQSTLDSGGLSLSEAYPDISDGAQVEVVNSSGAVVGVGTLSQQPVPAGQLVIDSMDMGTSEYFTFTVTGIPPGQARYGIKLGHDRGTVWESQKDMKNGVDLTLG